jgi:hypothetical protein
LGSLPTREPPTQASGLPKRPPQGDTRARSIDQLKGALAKAEEKLAADPGEVGKLERQLKALTTQVQNLKAKMRLMADQYDAGLATAGGMPFATQSAIAKCLHPDTRNHATEADRDKAFKGFTSWKADKDRAARKAK